MSHNYGFISDVDHPQFKIGWATNENGMWQYLGHRYCTTSLSRQCRLYQEEVKGLSRSYGVEL